MKCSTKAFLFLATFVGHDINTIAAESSGEKAAAAAAEDEQHGENQRNLISLAELWSIGEPTFVSDGLDLVLEYPLSTFVDQNMAYYEVYDANCQEGGTLVSTETVIQSPLVDVAPGSFTDEADFSIDGKTAAVEIAIDSSKITSDKDIYSETITLTTKRATIAFCVRFGLNTLGEDSPTEVNFLETIVELNLDLSSDISVDDVTMSEKDRIVHTTTKAYKVTGYLCEAGTTNQPLAEDGTQAHTQGVMVTVCVEPDADAASDGVVMRSIDSFEWTNDSVSQTAIESGTASNQLTSFDAIDCEGGKYCKFSSLLFAAFYDIEGEVRGSGVALLKFGTADNLPKSGFREANKGYELNQQHRGLQQGAATSTSGFGVKFSARAGDDVRPSLVRKYAGGTRDGTRTGKRMGALACSLVAVGGLVTVAALWWR